MVAYLIVLCVIAVVVMNALYCLLVVMGKSDYLIYEDDEQNKRFRLDILALVLALALFSSGVVLGMQLSVKPETEVVIETTESITAPDIDLDSTETTSPSVPEIEEIIPEETIIIGEAEPIPEPTHAPVPEETVPAVDPDELEMLACVIYQEAGGNGSCDDCRRYVADIVLNRVADDRFPDTMYEVLTAKGQYGRLHWTGIKWPGRAKYDTEKEAVARAYRIAEEVLSGNHSELYGNGYIWQAGFRQGTDGFWCCGHFYGR